MKKVILAVVSVVALSSSYAFAAEKSEYIQLAAAIGSGASTTAGSAGAGAASGGAAAATAAGATANMVAVGIVAASGIAVAAEAGSSSSH